MSRPQKSTIVRFQNRARRALFRSADLVAPNLAGRIARDIWFAVPPRLAPAPPISVLTQPGHTALMRTRDVSRARMRVSALSPAFETR